MSAGSFCRSASMVTRIAPRGVLDAGHHRGGLAVVAPELDHLDPRVGAGQRGAAREGPIAAAVVDEDDLEGERERRRRRRRSPRRAGRRSSGLVVGRAGSPTGRGRPASRSPASGRLRRRSSSRACQRRCDPSAGPRPPLVDSARPATSADERATHCRPPRARSSALRRACLIGAPQAIPCSAGQGCQAEVARHDQLDSPGRLPIKIDATSNGEFRPVPLTATRGPGERARRRAQIGVHAKRVGVARRAFLQSLCGAATTLLTLNQAFAARGNTGGALPPARARRRSRPRPRESALAGDEFIFDVQTHMVDPAGKWRANAGRYWEQILAPLPAGLLRRRRSGRLLLGRAVHQARVPGQRHRARGAVLRARAARAQPAVARGGRARAGPGRADGRARTGCSCTPWSCRTPARRSRRLQLMEDAVARYPIAAWKCYTQWGPDGVGWELDSPDGRHPVHRAGTRARRAQHLHPQGPAVLRLSGGVRALRRRRPGGEAVPGHELHHLSLGLRDRPPRKARSIRPAPSGASTP